MKRYLNSSDPVSVTSNGVPGADETLVALDQEDLAIYQNMLRIPITNFWKIYTIGSNGSGTNTGPLKTTSKSTLVVSEATSEYDVVAYSAKDFVLLKSELYPKVTLGNPSSITFNTDNVECYLLIWTTGELKATLINDTITGIIPEPINTLPMVHYAFDRIDATMSVLRSSISNGDIYPVDSSVIGPHNIGHQFDFELAISESAICIGYGLSPTVNWNTSQDPILNQFTIKMFDRPGQYFEVGPLACRGYIPR